MANSQFHDEDIKIATVSSDNVRKEKQKWAADDNIDLFILQRSIGNTDRARALGDLFVEDLSHCVWTKPPADVDEDEYELQLRLLFAYVVHRIVEDHSPNHILAHAALSYFYERLEAHAEPVFKAINASPAFSLYLYLHRCGEERAQTVGKTFAKLCRAEQNIDCAIIGESGYARFYGLCAQRILSAGYR